MPKQPNRISPQVRITLTPDCMGIVDGVVESLAYETGERNRSRAIRKIILEWYDTKLPKRRREKRR